MSVSFNPSGSINTDFPEIINVVSSQSQSVDEYSDKTTNEKMEILNNLKKERRTLTEKMVGKNLFQQRVELEGIIVKESFVHFIEKGMVSSKGSLWVGLAALTGFIPVFLGLTAFYFGRKLKRMLKRSNLSGWMNEFLAQAVKGNKEDAKTLQETGKKIKELMLHEDVNERLEKGKTVQKANIKRVRLGELNEIAKKKIAPQEISDRPVSDLSRRFSEIDGITSSNYEEPSQAASTFDVDLPNE